MQLYINSYEEYLEEENTSKHLKYCLQEYF